MSQPFPQPLWAKIGFKRFFWLSSGNSLVREDRRVIKGDQNVRQWALDCNIKQLNVHSIEEPKRVFLWIASPLGLKYLVFIVLSIILWNTFKAIESEIAAFYESMEASEPMAVNGSQWQALCRPFSARKSRENKLLLFSSHQTMLGLIDCSFSSIIYLKELFRRMNSIVEWKPKQLLIGYKIIRENWENWEKPEFSLSNSNPDSISDQSLDKRSTVLAHYSVSILHFSNESRKCTALLKSSKPPLCIHDHQLNHSYACIALVAS